MIDGFTYLEVSRHFSHRIYVFLAMAIFRQYIAPLLIVLVFVVALVAVGARIFLPDDMAAPAPIEAVEPSIDASESPAALAPGITSLAGLPSSLEILVKGLPLDADGAL
jgi:hypothetical protein